MARVAAKQESEEEIFSERVNLEESRLIQVTEEAEVRHQWTYPNLQDNEWTTVFVYFITDEEKEKISYQVEEVEPSGCQWVDFAQEKARYRGIRLRASLR